MQISKIRYQTDNVKLKYKARNNFVFLMCFFYFLILMFGFSLITGCAGTRTQAIVPVIAGQTEYEVILSTEDAWRAVMRFSDKHGYHLINLDSDKGMMEISGGDTYAWGYNAYGFHYTLLFVGLEKGTKIVIEGSFHNSDGKLVPPNDSLIRLKKENEYRILAALKKYFETELNHGTGKRT